MNAQHFVSRRSLLHRYELRQTGAADLADLKAAYSVSPSTLTIMPLLPC